MTQTKKRVEIHTPKTFKERLIEFGQALGAIVVFVGLIAVGIAIFANNGG